MAQVNMSVDTLSYNAHILKENVEIIVQSLNKIKSVNTELKQNWLDDRIGLLQDKLDDCDKMSIHELLDLCENLSNYIEEVMDAYKCTEEQMISAFYGE